MKCTADGSGAKVIAKAVQSLAKFGSELFVEADQHGLQLRSVNSTRSAVGTFKFSQSFFDSYQVAAGDENYCKIAMKACLMVFRNMKQVEQCEMRIMAEQAKFQVQLRCRLETVKNALISIVDEENITAAVSPDDTPNIISGSHKIFTEISSNFNTAEEEITLEAQSDCLTIKNYIEGSRVNDKYMRSQLKLVSNEFETYKIERETSVTFCLKEFRAFLLFAEACNENMTLNFDEGGSPVFLRIQRDAQVECLLIMSTLSAEDVSFYVDGRQSELTEESNQSCSMPKKRKLKGPTEGTPNVSKSRKRLAEQSTLSTDSTLFPFNDNNDVDATLANSIGSDAPSVDVARNAPVRDAGTFNNVGLLLASSPSSLASTSALVRRQSKESTTFSKSQKKQNIQQMALLEEEEKTECILQSPPRQKGAQLRSIFSRCFESTYLPREPSPSSQVYVPNSDSED